MAIAQPQSSDFLNSPDHSKLHRVLGVDTGGPNQGLRIDSAGDMVFTGSGQFAENKAVYFGGSGLNNSWRMMRSGAGLSIEKRESGNWLIKGFFS